MDQETTAKGIGRFTKHMIIGAVISGVVCSIPIVSCLNSLFCVLNMAGIVLALHLYLKAFPDDMLNTNESLIFGAIAGAGAGIITTILGIFVNMLVGAAMAALTSKFASGFPLGSMVGVGAFSIFMAPVTIVLYAAFGLLGSFLGMKLFFKTRLQQA